MSKSEKKLTKEKIGELYLLSQRKFTLGTKPGLIDRLLGEKDQRRIVYQERNIDVESEEYEEVCRAAYDEFKEKFGDNEKSLNAAIKKIEEAYKKNENSAQKLDLVNWSSVFANSLLLSKDLTSVAQNIIEIPNFSSNNQLAKSDFDLAQNFPIPPATISSTKITYPNPPQTPIDIKQTKAVREEQQLTEQTTFGDAIKWLEERSNNIPYGILAFTAASLGGASLPIAGVAGTLTTALTTLPLTNAVKVGDEDYETTVYCGPQTDCEHLRSSAKEKIIELFEFDRNQKISEKYKSVQRVLIAAHGYEQGSMALSLKRNSANKVEPVIEKPDYFAKKYFPNVKVIHAIGCSIGANPEENFGKNSLKAGQVLFLHAGAESLTAAILTSKLLYLISSENNNFFPIQEPLNIVAKANKGSTLFTEIPLPEIDFDQILKTEINIDETLKDETKIDALFEKFYTIIAEQINIEKNKVLEKFEDIAEEPKKIISSELDKLGYFDHTQEQDLENKKALVTDYLSRFVFERASLVNQSEENLEKLTRLGLVDVNHKNLDGSAPIFVAATDNDIKALKFLLKNGGDPNKSRNDGFTPLLMAAQKGHHEAAEILLKHGANANKSAEKDGLTPLLMAAQQGYLEIVKFLLDYGADTNQAYEDGTTPLISAIIGGDSTILGLLLEHGADPTKSRKDRATSFIIAAQLENFGIFRSLVVEGSKNNPALKEQIETMAIDAANFIKPVNITFARKIESLIKKQKEENPAQEISNPKATNIKKGKKVKDENSASSNEL